MKNLRFLILLVVLLIPSLIFVFLFLFAENQYDVEIQHPHGIRIEGCTNSSVPFQVKEIDSLGLDKGGFKMIYVEINSINKSTLNKLRRVTINNPDQKLFLLHHSNEGSEISEYQQKNWHIFKFKKEDLVELNRCGFGNINNQPLILIDPQQHVRGYYDLDNKELDRLEGEIKILTQ